MDKKVIIEVGGNQGQHTKNFVKPNTILYCFEPVHELYTQLWERYKSNPDVIILPFAIDIENSSKLFNIAAHKDWGCSSLNEFTDNIHEIWPGRPDFNFTHSYNVMTIRLDDFFKLYGINKVDYMWIDAQGHDYNVLQSMGDMISIVKEGRCEAAYNVELYKNTNNQHDKIVDYLNAKGFSTKVELDRSGIGAECDILFQK